MHEADVACAVAGKPVLKCLLSPDARQLATAASDKTVKLWNMDGFQLDRTLTGAALLIMHTHAADLLKSAAYTS